MMKLQQFSPDDMKSRREALHLTKSAFSREAGLHVSTVSQIELGRLIPYPGQVKKIERTLKRLEAERQAVR